MENTLDNFKSDILSSLASQLDILQTRQKKEDIEKAMAIVCPKCRKKHPLKECPLNSVEICALCEQRHATKGVSSLYGLKAVYEEKMGIEKHTLLLQKNHGNLDHKE